MDHIEALNKSLDIIEEEGILDLEPEALAKTLDEVGLHESALQLQNWGVLDSAAVDFLVKVASRKDVWNQTVGFLAANRKTKTPTPYNLPKKVEEAHALKHPEHHDPEIHAKAKIEAKKDTGEGAPQRPGAFEGEAHIRKTPVRKKVSWQDKDTGETRYKQVDSHKLTTHVWTGGKWNKKD